MLYNVQDNLIVLFICLNITSSTH